MAAWVLVSLCPPPAGTRVFVRRGPFMNDAAYDRFRGWVALFQAREEIMKDAPVEWWDPTADAVEERQEPAPIPQAEQKGQMQLQF